MIEAVAVFGGVSVDDLAKAKDFYIKTLGFKLKNEEMGLQLELPGGGRLFIYPKDDHKPATYTMLNLVVKDIDKAADQLIADGVKFEHYNNMPGKQDAKGVMHSQNPDQGPSIAWFKDPAGNILSIIEDDK